VSREKSASKTEACSECPRRPFARRQQLYPYLMARDRVEHSTGVLVRGALEEDDPETWDTRELGWAPKAESEGNRSWGRMLSGSRRAS